MHHTPLISTLVFGLGFAFIMGALAQRVRVSPLVGYLLAGVLVGPVTPGVAADPEIAAELAEIGVILLMFGVGLHFSIQDLLSVRRIAVPGAVGQIVIATLMGAALGWALGWSIEASLLFGLALSVASTVVMMRSLQERRLVDSDEGRIAVGWLVVEDLAMVLALVLIPALAGVEPPASSLAEHPEAAEPIAEAGESLWLVLAITIGKVAAFVAIMLIVGRRAIPWVMQYVAQTGSRELFRLAVLAIALGIAFVAAALFDVSLALGAFFAGMILNESPLAQRAAEESLPFRDAFAVLFFVSVGMIFEPSIIVEAPLAVLATAAVIIVGKSVASYFIVVAFGHSSRVALTISASLAQVGEFSFILAGLGVSLAILPEEGRDLILAGAIISILVNPLMFVILDRWKSSHELGGAEPGTAPSSEPLAPVELSHHAVVVGYGRVGSFAGEALIARDVPIAVIEDNPKIASELRARDIPVIPGNGVLDDVMEAANLAAADWLLVAIPEPFEASRIVRRGREINPKLTIIARAHFDAEVDHLRELGADYVIMGEREIAKGMVDHVLDSPHGADGAPVSRPVSSPAP
ncbi:MAG: Kef family K(+) transporter [Rhizobiales bacterium]|nr:Kef family K(+) transporter [Hyphomicrobiales bacterium]